MGYILAFNTEIFQIGATFKKRLQFFPNFSANSQSSKH